MNAGTNYEERIRELEVKITFLEDYVAKQNEVIVDQGRQLDRLLKAMRQLAEKAENFGGESMPANEKPPHW